MSFNFPSSPTEGATYTGANGAQYVYKSGVWMQVSAAQIKATALPRNRIVNGAMQISQENGNTAVGSNGFTRRSVEMANVSRRRGTLAAARAGGDPERLIRIAFV